MNDRLRTVEIRASEFNATQFGCYKCSMLVYIYTAACAIRARKKAVDPGIKNQVTRILQLKLEVFVVML